MLLLSTFLSEPLIHLCKMLDDKGQGQGFDGWMIPVPVLRHIILSNRTFSLAFSCLSPRLNLIVGLKWASGYHETLPEDLLYVLTCTTVLYIASFIQYIVTYVHGSVTARTAQA